MLSNAYFLAKFRFDTAENEPANNLQNFDKEICKNADLQILLALPAHLVDHAVEPLPGRGLLAQALPEPAHVGPTAERGTGRRHDGRSAKFRQNVARFRLYRHRFLQENTRFAAFFKIYQII